MGSSDELVIVESVIELHRPRYTRNDLKMLNAPAVGLWVAGSVFMAGVYISHPLIYGVGGFGVGVFAWVMVEQYSLIAGMVSTQTTTNYYESLDKDNDDNLSYPDEPKPDPTAYKLFDQWGIDADKFGRHLFNEVAEGKQITRDELAAAVKGYESKTGKKLRLNLTKRWGSGEMFTALKQVGFVDSIAEGEAQYMLPAQKLLDYRTKE